MRGNYYLEVFAKVVIHDIRRLIKMFFKGILSSC